MQFGGRATVGGRIGRQRRRDSAAGLQGRAVGNGAARSRCAGEVSRGRAGLAGADQCGVARGGGASGVTLAGVEDGEDLDRLGDAVDRMNTLATRVGAMEVLNHVLRLFRTQQLSRLA